jgi:2'-hydroxyisoflavone reductase
MRILVIGGTRLVGRQIVAAALDRGHDVTLFNRGKTDPDGFPTATHLVGDRNKDLSVLSSGEWDATIDVSAYGHQQVRSLMEALDGRGGHHTFISTISVYRNELPESGFTEEAPLLPPEYDDSTGFERYGEKKVACEEVTAAYAKNGLLIIRPGYVVGPYDYTERFTHWIRVVAAGQPFRAPAKDHPLQCIDGRDLGDFTIGCVERGVIGTFNATAPQDPPTFAQVLSTIASALDTPLPEIEWSDPDDASGDLPLAAPTAWWPAMRADLSKAVSEGLRWRPLEDTVRDTAAWAGISESGQV